MIARAYIGATRERQAIPITCREDLTRRENLTRREDLAPDTSKGQCSLRNYNNFTEVNPV